MLQLDLPDPIEVRHPFVRHAIEEVQARSVAQSACDVYSRGLHNGLANDGLVKLASAPMRQNTIDSRTLSAAIADWIGTLGAEHVITDESIVQAAGTATFATLAQVGAILRPANRRDV